MKPKTVPNLECNSELSLTNPKGSDQYSRLFILDSILRSNGYSSTIISDDQIEIVHVSRNGYKYILRITSTEKTVEFLLDTLLVFKTKNDAVLAILNELNDKSRVIKHCEFWSLGYQGKVYLFSLLIDDDRLSEMSNPIVYIVSEMLEFAEYGVNKIVSTLSESYAPSQIDFSQMYG